VEHSLESARHEHVARERHPLPNDDVPRELRHRYYSVPTYPASHGCVRVPIWEADWLYDQSPVGERVYVYE
jgi:hypothetical protein